MKTNLLTLIAALGVTLSFTSCVPFDPAFDGGGYGGGGYSSGPAYSSGPSYYGGGGPSYYNDNDFYYHDGRANPSYYGRPYGSYTTGYSYYRGSSVCPICHHSPCSGHSGRSSGW